MGAGQETTERFHRSWSVPSQNARENLKAGEKISTERAPAIVVTASLAISDWPRSKSSSEGARKNKMKKENRKPMNPERRLSCFSDCFEEERSKESLTRAKRR